MNGVIEGLWNGSTNHNRQRVQQGLQLEDKKLDEEGKKKIYKLHRGEGSGAIHKSTLQQKIMISLC